MQLSWQLDIAVVLLNSSAFNNSRSVMFQDVILIISAGFFLYFSLYILARGHSITQTL